MITIVRITPEKKLLLKNEMIEGDKVSFNASGTLHVKEIVEGNNFSITDNKIEVIEFIDEGLKIQPINEDLILWLDSKMGSGTVWEDLSGNNNHVTLFNFDFDGNDGWIENALRFDNRGYGLTDNEIDFGQRVTFESYSLMKNYVATSSVINNLYRTFSGFSTNIQPNRVGIVLIEENLIQRSRNIDGAGINMYNPIHLVTVYDNGQYRVYINGELYGVHNEMTVMGTSQIAIGRWAVNHPYYPFDGDIYMCRAYNKALTEKEVLQNYQSVLEGGI